MIVILKIQVILHDFGQFCFCFVVTPERAPSPTWLGFCCSNNSHQEDMNRCITHMRRLSGAGVGARRAGPKPVHSGFSKDKNEWFGFLSYKGLGLGSRCPCRGLGFERCELFFKKKWAALISLPSCGARRKGGRVGLRCDQQTFKE